MNLVIETLPRLSRNSVYRTEEWKWPSPEKAHRILTAFKARKDFKPRPCCVCGAPNAHGHHENYNRFREVAWLCIRHHADRHHELWLERKAKEEAA